MCQRNRTTWPSRSGSLSFDSVRSSSIQCSSIKTKIVSSVESQVKDLKEKILKSRTGLFDLSHYQDIHLICGVVKDFLRSLSEPLLTNVLWKSFATITDEESESIKQEKIDSLLHQLPKPNRDTLAFLILHLQRVASSPLCRMSILNLSRTMVISSLVNDDELNENLRFSFQGSSHHRLFIETCYRRRHRR